MTAAYYSRNQSYSKSLNAEEAEGEGRLPRSRAAKFMGLSLAAFDAGCEAADYVATEWHHVGKYANECSYYDTVELGSSYHFWRGAMRGRPRAKLAFRAWMVAGRERLAAEAAREEASNVAEAERLALAIRLYGDRRAELATLPALAVCQKRDNRFEVADVTLRAFSRVMQLGSNVGVLEGYDPEAVSDARNRLTL